MTNDEKKEVFYICIDCGLKHGSTNDGVCTVHEGICDICHEKKGITHKRNYNWLRK